MGIKCWWCEEWLPEGHDPYEYEWDGFPFCSEECMHDCMYEYLEVDEVHKDS